MSVGDTGEFGVESLGIDGIEGNTSILLTGEDTAALEAVFYRLVAPAADERSVVLATDASGREVQRSLGDVTRGADDRTTVLTAEGPDRDAAVTTVGDITDLSTLGMEFSTLVAEATRESGKFRSGIMLCSSVLAAVDDTRSVYRFLNSNFLTELRRGGGVGVCAIDTSADIGSDMNSTLSGLETSFTARVNVESAGRRQATLDVSGLPGTADSLDVSW